MSTVECPKCGHTVSDEAETCPSCGLRRTEDAIQLKLELTQIDLEWERERQNYMQQAVFGGLKVPRKKDALIGALLVSAMGIVIGIVFAAAGGEAGMMAGIASAVSCLLISLVVVLIQFPKAERYEQAEAEYRRKREAGQAKTW